jgi:hypothetical protein
MNAAVNICGTELQHRLPPSFIIHLIDDCKLTLGLALGVLELALDVSLQVLGSALDL